MTSHQGRYVMHHMYDGPIECEGDADLHYYLNVKDRREDELDNLAYYAGWDKHKYRSYVSAIDTDLERIDPKGKRNNVLFLFKHFGRNMLDSTLTRSYPYAVATLLGILGLIFMHRFVRRKRVLRVQ